MSVADELAAAFDERRSARAFRPEPIPEPELRRLFAMAQRAPSWCNIQPWRVWVTSPPATAALSAALLAAARAALPAPEVPFPGTYPEPYLTHRRACGHALYAAMGIARDDKESRYGAWLRNYELFDAPHVAVVARDRALDQYGTLDVGVWLGFLLSAAAALGIDTCPMASLAAYPAALRRELGIPADQVVLFGVALGRADRDAPANACRTARDPVDANVTFVDRLGLAAPAPLEPLPR
ncbi:MAG TPA: nitroreductase [Kofleriaceae bacterium]|nr:nitroreductase [Kofleriaceae bacterium]